MEGVGFKPGVKEREGRIRRTMNPEKKGSDG